MTFLFTDIEGSTALLLRLDDGYVELLAEHHRILHEAFESAGGDVFGSAGDALFAAFDTPRDAIVAAVRGQLALQDRNRQSQHRVAVRMGVHTGPATIGPTGYVGLALHQTARVSALAQGFQVLVSDTTALLLAGEDLEGALLEDLGPVRLKGVPGTPHVFCLRHPELPLDFPSLEPLAAQGTLPVPLTSFVNREQERAS